MWLFYLGVHLFGFVGYNLLLRKSVLENVDSFKLATIMQTGITIPLLFSLFFVTPDFGSYDQAMFLMLIAVLVLTIALHVTNTMSYQFLEASVYSVLYNLRIIFTTILGVLFLNEETDILRIAGGLLILAAIFIVRQKGSSKLLHRGMEWGIAAALTISFLNLFEKELINKAGYLSYAVPLMVLASIIMWGYLYYRDRQLDLVLLVRPKMIALMGLRCLSAYGFIMAFVAGAMLSVANYISSMGVIFMVVFGVLLLKETDYLRQKIIATAVACIGLTLVLVSKI